MVHLGGGKNCNIVFHTPSRKSVARFLGKKEHANWCQDNPQCPISNRERAFFVPGGANLATLLREALRRSCRWPCDALTGGLPIPCSKPFLVPECILRRLCVFSSENSQRRVKVTQKCWFPIGNWALRVILTPVCVFFGSWFGWLARQNQ